MSINRITSQAKGKSPSTTTENCVPKTKAIWDRFTTKIFIDACQEQINKGERLGSSLSKKGWRDAIAKFNAESGRTYNKMQLKNKWDSLRKSWSAWYNLFQYETGLGWDNERHTFIASSEWWDAKELENPEYATYRHEGLPYARELTFLYKDKTATGEYAWAPSSGVLPDGYDEDGQPNDYFVSAAVDNNEGSGDSEDSNIGANLGGSGIGVSDINLDQNTSSHTGTARSGGSARSGDKRKRGGEIVRKGKVSGATIIGQHLKTMASAVESHASAIKAKNEDPYSIGIAMAGLHRLTDVLNDDDFYGRCCELLMDKAAREVFCTIPDDDHKIIFLRRMAYRH